MRARAAQDEKPVRGGAVLEQEPTSEAKAAAALERVGQPRRRAPAWAAGS